MTGSIEAPPTSRSLFVATAEARQVACETFEDHANGKSGNDIACPVRQQEDPGPDEQSANRPNCVSLGRRQFRCRRGKRPHVYGMPGRKCIERAAGKWNAVQMSPDSPPIGAHLIELPLQEVG